MSSDGIAWIPPSYFAFGGVVLVDQLHPDRPAATGRSGLSVCRAPYRDQQRELPRESMAVVLRTTRTGGAMSSAAASTPSPRRDWEAWLAAASAPASATEEAERDRTLAGIRKAIQRAPDIPSSVRVYVKGSYANNTNVRRDADVDVAAEWTDTFKVHTWGDTAGMTAAQLGYEPAVDITGHVGGVPAPRRERAHDRVPVRHGRHDARQAHGIGGLERVDADVVPCYALNRYDAPRVSHRGHRIFPKSGATPVDNYPQQNYDNGVTKNNATRRRYKEIVRCTKRLIDGASTRSGCRSRDYPGYLTESLVYNAPNSCFGHTRAATTTCRPSSATSGAASLTPRSTTRRPARASC